jgi:hypothetical protein
LAVVRLSRWAQLVHEHFGFLTERGFARSPEFDHSSDWTESVTYRSDRHAIEVMYSREFIRAEVRLSRLKDGELPAPMIFYSDDADFDMTLLDNVVEARTPERVSETRLTGLGEKELHAQLEMWARLLREVASDFLEGEDNALDEAREIVRGRVEDEPQQIVVWLREGATDKEQAEAVQRARSNAPSNVEVVARRLRQ